ncbi:mandelate racemase/muconate lactonizing enzyme family protein [Aquimarina sp. U1-2]|uniref:mandelate racemase/muconate lactonizing enzyme family protein n=1 Tax=Aquimarina sp. U1-2 TaxID=2823141 RepID=UPI001AEC7FBD|nr:mandelate racemase/muconate lactonizing enzyme family protein [Aquimarina sp. U1-2]MBP2834225.1 mandelate racemase/muconate lactonizing enzyme family protein [Aquimarina sp. U1-2]
MKKSSRRTFLGSLGLAAAAAAAVNASPLVGKTLLPELDTSKVKDLVIQKVETFLIKRMILIKVTCSDGTVGWGESSSNSPMEVVRAFIDETMGKAIIGKNPFDTNAIWQELFWVNHDLGPSGALSYAVAGIDLALWDIKGKLTDQPVYNLLGGKLRDRIPAYAGIPLRGGSIPVNEAIARAKKLADIGFKVVKLRMQIREYDLNPQPDPTVKYYKAIRKALPDDVALFVDPNEGYTAAQAILIGKELQQLGMPYFESPVPRENNVDLKAIVAALDIPVWAGEKCYTRWEFRDLISQGNPDVINPDLIKAGGISEVKRIADLAQVFFKQVVPHNTKPTLGTAAALHLMASIENAGPLIEFVELDTYKDVLSIFPKEQLHYLQDDGTLKVPELAGLGMEVNEKQLKKVML